MPVPNNSPPCNSSGYIQLLQQAVKNWDKKSIVALLENGVDCTSTEANGETILHFAIKNTPGNSNEELIIDIFEIFHKAGVDLHAKDTSCRTVLNISFKNGLTELTKSLIKWGANINEPDFHGNTIAHYLADNSTSSSTRTTDLSTKWKDASYVDWLLSMGLDVDCKNNNKATPLHLAAKHNLPHVLLKFLKYCKVVDAVDNDSRTVFHIFVAQDKMNSWDPAPGVLGSVSESTNKDGVYEQLLLRGFSVDAVDLLGNTPVHIAARLKKIARVKFMIDSFMNVNAQNDRGETVLSILCKIGDGTDEAEISNLVRALILKGTNIHASRTDGVTPVQLAAVKKRPAILRILSEYGADFTELWCQRNLLHLVCQKKFDPSKDEEYKAMIDFLVSKRCDVNAKDGNGTTPLHLASISATVAVVERLIKHGANVHNREWIKLSFTALHLAVKARQTRTVALLVGSGADVNAKDLTGRTPLHWAAKRESKITGLLLELGAETSVRDEKGYMPFYYAIKSYNIVAIMDLVNYGDEINDVVNYNCIMNLKGNERVLGHMMEHWTKLKYVGLPASSYYEKFQLLISLQFRKMCKEEVQTLKTSSIDDGMSLYNFLHASPNAQCAFTNDDKFRMFVQSPDFANKFPNYHGLVLARYYKAMQRKSLLKVASYNWYDLTNVHLPDICKYAIFDNLTNMELECLTEENTNEEPIVKKDFAKCSQNSQIAERYKRRRH